MRRADLFEAFHHLTAALIRLGFAERRFCQALDVASVRAAAAGVSRRAVDLAGEKGRASATEPSRDGYSPRPSDGE